MELDEEYFKDRNFLNAEQLQKERELWNWIDNNYPLTKNVTKAYPIMGEKLYLRNNTADQDLQLNLQ